ncbi:MAG: glycine cleavage system protein GcvH [Gammaproteobacteria bacterium]|nr:glycine cleavage system protein GcvH [Gammaproteobacteria bacterium]
MSSDISERIYTQNHVWLQAQNECEFTLGITDFAQDQLGDIVFVELPEAGINTQAGKACLVVESVKSASDVICPVEGKIIEVNEQLGDEPELINESPYEKGWIVKIKVDQNHVIEGKMTMDEYNSHQSK